MLIILAGKAADVAIEQGTDMIEFMKNDGHFFIERKVLETREAKIYDIENFLAIILERRHFAVPIPARMNYTTSALEF